MPKGYLIICFLILCAFRAGDKKQEQITDFQLKNIDGKMVSLASYPDAKGFIIVFTCNHCPFAKLYPERLNELNKKYLPLHMPLIAISSSDTVVYDEDVFSEMVKNGKANHINYPYLYDYKQEVAKQFKADKTPHAFVIWKENGSWVMKYNGAIDDNGAEPQKVKHSYVAEAVDALLKGKEVLIAETKSIGCQIKFR